MEIIRGKKKKPFNVMLLGTPGIGKSTWAASCPSPIFITAEGNRRTGRRTFAAAYEIRSDFRGVRFCKEARRVQDCGH
jgi:septin family protein